MSEEVNPIKEHIFEFINKSKTIPELIAQKKYDHVINEVINGCYEKIISMDKKEDAMGVLATALLHYLLTNALIASQRKIEHNGIELDIVIPDIKTLEKDPKRTLIISIPKSNNKKIIQSKIRQLERIQSEKENIWIILSENILIDKKTFLISKDDQSFSRIIFEIGKFVNFIGENKFKILKI